MEIIESILTNNDCYRANRKITVQGLMIHSVGCSQPKAEVFIKQWNKSGVQKCVHAFIQPDGKVYQTLPWDMRGWHAGGSANNTHIGVEMTEPATIKYVNGSAWIDNNPTKTKEHVLATYQVAVELFAYLCKKFNLNPLADSVIISHHEGNIRGIASNHADVEHIWKKFGLTMQQFRNDIKNAMRKEENKPSAGLYRVRKTWEDVKSQIGAYSVLENAKKQADTHNGYKVYDENGNQVYPPIEAKQVEEMLCNEVKPANIPFLVKVTADALNVRQGPGTNYSITGVIKDKGVYTIVKTNGNWGRLKSGAGWISLKYTKRLA
jgi:N-acetylmuramoyl-L-alanine amidase CwlA